MNNISVFFIVLIITFSILYLLFYKKMSIEEFTIKKLKKILLKKEINSDNEFSASIIHTINFLSEKKFESILEADNSTQTDIFKSLYLLQKTR